MVRLQGSCREELLAEEVALRAGWMESSETKPIAPRRTFRPFLVCLVWMMMSVIEPKR
jgi:hypothetical protein